MGNTLGYGQCYPYPWNGCDAGMTHCTQIKGCSGKKDKKKKKEKCKKKLVTKGKIKKCAKRKWAKRCAKTCCDAGY